MAQQNYVRLNVALDVNGVSCSISEELFTTFLEQITTYKQYKSSIGEEVVSSPKELWMTCLRLCWQKLCNHGKLSTEEQLPATRILPKKPLPRYLNDEQVEVSTRTYREHNTH
jgi:hypothetical protein